MEIRDPIHKGMHLDPSELAVADHPWVQRLRRIAQTGFAYLPFPGATHSRFSHSLGVMHLAGWAFDSAYADWTFEDPAAAKRLRAAVRIAALVHDLGHAPFSHCTEFAMPSLADLGSTWLRGEDRRATHEDYTIAILELTDLARTIQQNFSFTAQHVAALISQDVKVKDDFFRDGGFDHRRLLSQIVSSELDVDRLDYLRRDSLFTGAGYGNIEVDWLISNLTAWPANGQVWLGLHHSALYAFDHFLIARHHMFLMVYFHHKSVIFEEMLKRYVTAPGQEFELPADLDAYREVDDVQLWEQLRRSQNPWARRVVDLDPWRRVAERHGTPAQSSLEVEERLLIEAGIEPMMVTSTGRLSHYASSSSRRRRVPSLYVVHEGHRATRLDEATGIFDRYADARAISRVYVAPEHRERAQALLDEAGSRRTP